MDVTERGHMGDCKDTGNAVFSDCGYIGFTLPLFFKLQIHFVNSYIFMIKENFF